MNSSDLASGILYYIVFLISTTVHEAAPAWAAKRVFVSAIYLDAAYG